MLTTGDISGTIDVGNPGIDGIIGTIFAGGNINADIHAPDDISFIRANGNINGSIISDTGRILEVEAGLGGAGNIGTSVKHVLITADGAVNGSGTRKIIGDSIYADIDMAAGPNGGGPFGRLQTRTGDFDGSLHVNQLVSNNGNADIIIAGNLNADITVDNQVETLISTGGDFTKTMTIGGALSGAMKGILIGGDLTASASIAIAGDIDAPITVDGDILDNTTTPSIFAGGSLFNDGINTFGAIDVLGSAGNNGDLSGEIFITGDLAGPIHLTRNIIATLTPMASINIGGSIKADAVSGMEGQILIDGSVFGDITIGSDVEGLIADDATRNIDILGNMQGLIDIGGSITQNADVAMDTIGYANTMQIGKSLDGHIFVEVDDVSGTNGLHGQIIVNADDLGNSWSSTGSVQVGVSPEFIVLSQPKYTITPNFLGGGAVGEVKIMLHDEASEPVNNGSGSNLESIKLRFYGPVKSLTSSCPVLVERKNMQGDYIDVTSSMIFSFSPYDLTNGVFKTTLNLSQSGSGTITPGTYRISATSNLVGDFGTMPPVRPFGTNGYYNVIVN